MMEPMNAEAKTGGAQTPRIHLGILENDPLRLIGYQTVFKDDPAIALYEGTVESLLANREIQVLLLGNPLATPVFETVRELRKQRPDLRILVTGSHGDDETILRSLSVGAKGYMDKAAPAADFLQAVHILAQGSIWAPRRLLSQVIERVLQSPAGHFVAGKIEFTPREREVLELLVAGRSNREIAQSMGIEERTVKAHVAKLLRKVGVQNRIALTMHTINYALLEIQREPEA
jgi:DNA-binding NarL/FixJ family response regulator